ncbi:MAG TPA: hypothetical protein PKW63_11445 [Vicinamibacterales bacterium]|nr:hypothetical protein [Vicinamibacterales bacterium]
MRNLCMGVTAVIVCVSVSGMTAAGQGRSFSGTWVVDAEKTMEARREAMSSSPTGVMVAGGGGGGRGGAVVSSGGGAGGGTMVASGGGGGAVVARGGGAGGGTMVASGGGGGAVAGGGGGGRGGVIASVGGTPANAETIIALDSSTFSIEIGGVRTAYPLNGSDVVVQMRGAEGRAHASWAGDKLVIETTMDTANGPVVNRTSWSIEGDALVRETASKTYYKRK